MNRSLWTNDQKQIIEALNTLIDGGFATFLQRCSGKSLRTRVISIRDYHKRPYVVLTKPVELEDSRSIKELCFKIPGLPILGFSCPIIREGGGLLASLLPTHIFQIDLRSCLRLPAPPGSMATFFAKGRARVSICMMEAISMGGVKLMGNPTIALTGDDLIGPCTISFAGRDALISREVTINKATVVRIKSSGNNASQHEMAFKFELSGREEVQLKEHVNFLTGNLDLKR